MRHCDVVLRDPKLRPATDQEWKEHSRRQGVQLRDKLMAANARIKEQAVMLSLSQAEEISQGSRIRTLEEERDKAEASLQFMRDIEPLDLTEQSQKIAAMEERLNV